MKSLKIGKISWSQVIVLLIIVLLLLYNGSLYRSYRQEKQKETELTGELAAASSQVAAIKKTYSSYNITRPADISPRLQEELDKKQGELAVAGENSFPQRVEGVEIAEMIVKKKGTDITLEKLEMSPPGEKTVGASKYHTYQYVISASVNSEQALTSLKEWLQGIEGSSLPASAPRFKTLYTGDIQLSLDDNSWKADFKVTVLMQ